MEPIQTNPKKELSAASSHIDLSKDGRAPLKFGEETLFVNACITDGHYNPTNAPWVIDLDLPKNPYCDSPEHEGEQDVQGEALGPK